jgi:hypothetical protein
LKGRMSHLSKSSGCHLEALSVKNLFQIKEHHEVNDVPALFFSTCVCTSFNF